ncbi:MAG: hypothetical protein E7260_01105 [Lachnospiraceae bacterium]|nr:hypothetical protein [Lachnospiraceae bacterium]
MDDRLLGELSKLSGVLEKVGIFLSVDRHFNDENKPQYDLLRVKVEEEHYKKIVTRNAGRKQNFIEKYEKYRACTVEELNFLLASMTKTKIAESLGCSRMTLYRIIKNIEKYEPEGNMSVWHYTSGR